MAGACAVCLRNKKRNTESIEDLYSLRLALDSPSTSTHLSVANTIFLWPLEPPSKGTGCLPVLVPTQS